MHPRYVDLFKAIEAHDNSALAALVKAIPEAAWVINDEGVGALQYALNFAKVEANQGARAPDRTSAFIFLDHLIDIAFKTNTEEAKYALHYALFITIKDYIKLIKPEATERLYFDITSEFTFLKPTGQTGFGYFVGKVGGSSAAQHETRINDFKAELVKELQTYIRALSVGGSFKYFFGNNGGEVNNVLSALLASIQKWRTKPIFAQHAQKESTGLISTGMNYGLNTHTVKTFIELEGALRLLIENKGELPKNLDSEKAKSLILLCAKCHPFSSTQMSAYWAGLANTILEAKSKDSKTVDELYALILDKQWLRTDDGIPYSSSILNNSLLKGITKSNIITLLQLKEVSHLAASLESNLDLVLHTTQVSNSSHEVLALYPLTTGRKVFASSPLIDKNGKQYAYQLLMNNPNLSLAFNSTDLKDNPLDLFPQVPNDIVLEITHPSQMIHLVSQLAILGRRQKTMTIGITRSVLKSDHSNWLHDLQKTLGPTQSVIIQIYNDLSHEGLTPVQADALLTSHDIDLGPITQESNTPSVRPIYKPAFYELYQKMNWSDHLDLQTKEEQYNVIVKALSQNKPLHFVFNCKYIDMKLLEEVGSLLREKHPNEVCHLRFDANVKPQGDNPILTVENFRITADGVTLGPLKAAKLCVKVKPVTTFSSTPKPPSPASSSSSSSSRTSTAIILRPSVSTAVPQQPQIPGSLSRAPSEEPDPAGFTI